MTHDIETFESTAGWTSTGSITAALCQWPQYIACHKAAAVLFTIPANSKNKSVSKTLNVSMAGKPEIVLSVWSQRKARNSYQAIADFQYLIEFANGVSFYLPIWEGFNQVSFFVPGLTTVTRIKITPLSNDDDALLFSACVAAKDEYPADVMAGAQAEIKLHMAREAGNGLLIGTVSATAGDQGITLAGQDYIDRMCTVLITDGVNSEIHAIDESNGSRRSFASTYDGATLLHSYSNASVYLNFPVEFGRYDQDAVMPGVFIWKMAPSPVLRSSDVDDVFDSVSSAGWNKRRTPLNLVYHLLIDCEAHQPAVLAILSRAVRRWLGSNELWINGRLHTFQWSIDPEEVEPDQSVEQFPKVQYTVDIEVQEEREDRQGLVGVSAVKLSASPVGALP